MIREPRELSGDVHRHCEKVVLALGRDRFTMSASEAIRLADRLVDAAEKHQGGGGV